MHCKRDLGWFTPQVVGIATAEPCDYPEMNVTVDFQRDQGDSYPFDITRYDRFTVRV